MSGPLIAVPARFSSSASALRYAAVVNARAVLEGVARAGGEPLTVLPRRLAADPQSDPARAVEEIDGLLGWAGGVLLPGGGDLHPGRYGQPIASDAVYDVDHVQDEFDLAVARWALDAGVPLLAVCRGMQVVNVALGGTLFQHMDDPHQGRLHEVRLDDGLAAGVFGAEVTVSCFHHQCVDRLGEGLNVVGRAGDGTAEAFERPGSPGWFLGVQWHPEDTASCEPEQQAAFGALVAAARARAAVPWQQRPESAVVTG